MWWLWLGLLCGMVLLSVLTGMILDGMRAKRAAAEIWARYEPRHAVTAPREVPDPWAAILRPPEPSPEPSPDTVTLPELTATGEFKAITDAWIAEHCPGETTL